ncbi:MEKHLA domain-containing protein [Cytophaga aurantiaca]|uniref:MEKHLA domain-containing protein n=1 Tax=Cytophaga aurantiaca TaxID=29530 RepID=UPI00036AB559|nr:MEKHLA domain-containing protein [Cytophaga aurantiaca]
MQKNIIPYWLASDVIQHSRRILTSYEQITGIHLFDAQYSDEYRSYLLYHAPYVVVSHGIQTDPVFNYANLTAQQLWNLSWQEFTALPSRLSAEPERAEERQRLLNEAAEKGYIDNYEGIRISSDGQRFKIEKVLLWNLPDEAKNKVGQVALFRNWTDL